MENEIQQLRNRVSSLQADLETSEAVQRDFVQLSQQLQVTEWLVELNFIFIIRYIACKGPTGKDTTVRKGASMAIRRRY